uniref:hypothetical protein n=1 Tax=Enterocloster hominis (ex Hitch et al. 2024) TaxID=1917870 RepID=UPI001031991D
MVGASVEEKVVEKGVVGSELLEEPVSETKRDVEKRKGEGGGRRDEKEGGERKRGERRGGGKEGKGLQQQRGEKMLWGGRRKQEKVSIRRCLCTHLISVLPL